MWPTFAPPGEPKQGWETWPASTSCCRTPWLHLSHGALIPCRNADRETQSGQALSLHHSCYPNTSSHHHFLPRPWCSSLLTGLPASALVPPLSHSPASSEKECFRTSQIISLLMYNPLTVSHFPENRLAHLQTHQPHPTPFSPLPTESRSQFSFSPSHQRAQTHVGLSVWGSSTLYSHHSSSVADSDSSDLSFNVFRVFRGAFSGHQIQQYPLPLPSLLQPHSMHFLWCTHHNL